MKNDLKIISNISAVTLLALTALGQDSPPLSINEANSVHQNLIQARGESWNGAAKATDVIGLTVKNDQDQKLGKVSDLALDVESGRIVEVIISTGGFLGLGTSLTAVPPGALQRDAAQHDLKLDMSKEKFSAAARFDEMKWDESTQSNRLSETYGYYGQQPYFAWGDYGKTNADGTFAYSSPRNMDGTINTAGQRPVEAAHTAEAAGNAEVNHYLVSSRKLGFIERASKLMGVPVKNLQDENLGKVDNFALDLSAGRIVAVVVASGGFMGIDNELSAVPPTAFRFDAEHDTLEVDASKDNLVSAPHFKGSEWPDLSQPDYFTGVYRAYNVQPYFTTGVDNTRLNVRDIDSRTLTPLDQGTDPADIDTTAQIRKGIIADPAMTINGKNVKIITLNGRVTLRGPVNSADEKSRIGDIANRIATTGNVDNQLEVSTTPSSN
jgi:sporulation protein YlmC with PRC-barrel domain